MERGKQGEFDRISRDIKSVKIQGARNIARAALKAYYLIPTRDSKKKLISLRPTEPMLQNVLQKTSKQSEREILEHFDSAQDKINKLVFQIVKNHDTLFTHCHSTNVNNALIYAKRHGKKFEVYVTESRPLYQGRKTAEQLRKAGIRVTLFVDSAVSTAMERENRKDKTYATKVFLGADALLKKGIINKVGSKETAEIAFYHKVPFYIVADSWKYTSKKISIENRSLNEVWDKAPKNIKIKNPAFEFVEKKYITKIISEVGTLDYDKFLKIVNKKDS